jgi:hypothetical protein
MVCGRCASPVNAALSASFGMRTANCPREVNLRLSDSRRFLLSDCNAETVASSKLNSKNRISQFSGSGETENVAEITKEI